MFSIRIAKIYAFTSTALLTIIGCCMLLPFYWMVINSLKPATSVIRMPPDLSFYHLTWENYEKLFADSIVSLWTFNSFLIAICGMFGNVIICSMAGYAFAKKNFPGKRMLFWFVMSIMMTSTQVIMIPLFMLIRDMGLLNSYWGLILPVLVSPFAVFMTKQFMQSIPNELIAAAQIDGSSEWFIYWKIILPLSKPVLAIVAIFSFITQWNDFLWPLLATESREMRTLQVGVSSMQLQNVNYGLVLAGSVWTMIPVVLLFVSFQRFFVRGITIGAVKG
ncbi:carbohydrate ABC transporter permease [Cohnella silvisoli]|uniref:Carbohydrate ABC transporter permease n=1 Tax=Cohnella silvisoli TaxID=2873699 RepID=A0ABV1L0T4_9BACL|nr:carbohydrate ABC transporter permease [Cohnella silvisoli]MCD9025306.1 carbohydrate ABC transporter permease [Cohnella silvisoli]